MKNLMFWVAALAMVFFTSCQQEQTTVVENATVDFTISTPAISTRADEFDTTGKDVAYYGDGATVNVLKYALYEAELNADGTVKNLIGDAKPGTKAGAFPDDATETTIEGVSAIKGKTYAAFFWAEAEGDPYTVAWTAEGPIASLNDEAALANNENLDAFFGVHTFTLEESGQLEKNIYLKRPFAQLNIATTDKSDAEAAKVTVTQTEIELTAPNSLNLLTGRTIGSTTVKLQMSDIPEGMYVDLGKDGKYDLLSFNYIFVDGDPYTANDQTKVTNQEVTFRYKYSEDAEDVKEYTFDGITLQRNHRTYVVGSLLTEEVIFNVKINPVWEDSHIFHGNGTGSTPPEPVDVPEPANITTMDGDGRVSVSWEAEEGLTTNVTIGENTVQVMASRAAASKNQIFNELAEGDHTITLVNVDAEGNESDPVKVTAHAYGANYKASLTTRNMSNLAYAGGTKVATPTFEAWDKGMYTAITYTGASEAILVQNNATTATLSNVALGEEITYYTVYKPNNCMDSFDGPKKTAIARSIVSLNAMTFNLGNHSATSSIVNMVKNNNIDVVGFQEVDNPSYYTTLINAFGSDYAGVAYHRQLNGDDEGGAIIYNKNKFEKVSERRFWFNITDVSTQDPNKNNPNVAGMTTWGGQTAEHERFAIWVILREKSSGIEFFFTTTHLDNKDELTDTSNYGGLPVQWGQARTLRNHCSADAKYTGTQTRRSSIIVGDMNCNPDKKPMLDFKELYSDSWELAASKSSPDSRDGYVRSTMIGITGKQKQWVYFDYIYLGGDEDCKMEVLKHTIHEGSYIVSDHNAVSVQLKYTYPNPE